MINIKNGLSYGIKMKCLLDMYTSELTTNDFDKDLLKYAINRNIGFEDDFFNKRLFLDWYRNIDIKTVTNSFKLICSKGRKFVNSFYRFYKLETKSIEYLYENINFKFRR